MKPLLLINQQTEVLTVLLYLNQLVATELLYLNQITNILKDHPLDQFLIQEVNQSKKFLEEYRAQHEMLDEANQKRDKEHDNSVPVLPDPPLETEEQCSVNKPIQPMYSGFYHL